MIAYKDAFRLNISLGDKVLAPWQNDGRYGPGTVLDGCERRDTQVEGTFSHLTILGRQRDDDDQNKFLQRNGSKDNSSYIINRMNLIQS
jgi:hypothetical protein